MRRLGPLLLVVIVAVIAVVAGVHLRSKARQQSSAPPVPTALPSETSAVHRDLCWSQTEGNRTVAEVCAKRFSQLKSPSRLYLEDVEVKVFAADGATFDRIRTANAEFDTEDSSFYAGGEVEITTGESAGDEPGAQRVFIRTSGLKYESKTGRASTDRPTAFRFEHGEGRSVGAAYEPEYRELHLRSQAVLTYRRSGAKAEPLTVETGELIYKERDSAILVGPWYRLKRGEMAVEGGKGVLWLKEGDISRIEAFEARGTDRPEADRQVEYAAGQIFIEFGAGGEVERIAADRNARLASVQKSSRTSVTAAHMDLDFDLAGGASRLRRAVARGGAVVESLPAPSLKPPRPPVRTLHSDVIELSMGPDGREISDVRTGAPGVIEFLPSQPGQGLRRLEADRIFVTYAQGNHIRGLEATRASTRTERPRPSRGPAPPPMLTWSRDLKAEFDPERSELLRLEQWGDFRYEEGDRRGRAGRAVSQTRENLVTLSESARIWDAAGSLAADKIVMDQSSGDVSAEGSVASTREPEPDSKPSAVLSQGDPLHARSARMFLTAGGRRARYEGGVVVWQAGNRIEADWVEIDRGERTLVARGNVRSRFVEQSDAAKKRGAVPVFTLVRAPELYYADKTRTAEYRGGADMVRAGMTVSAADLRGIFAAGAGSSELEKAYADGDVRIAQAAPGRTRLGRAEHAEYVVAQGKIVLSGGRPEFTDSLRGSTRGAQLTWFADDDRLLVDGRDTQPASSVIRLK
ncbi:MAG: LPS export ABC transporter periplasmic protein LptC [Bryobacterales bacterium]|nr:LPS export ABC transporter periplasmic protein LptC [Bryobacterales bacterium]